MEKNEQIMRVALHEHEYASIEASEQAEEAAEQAEETAEQAEQELTAMKSRHEQELLMHTTLMSTLRPLTLALTSIIYDMLHHI